MTGAAHSARFVLGLVVGLFLQFGFSLLFGEPYPSIRYPAFQTIYDQGDGIEVSRPQAFVCLVEAEPRPIELEELFAPIPQSFLANVLETLRKKAVPAPDLGASVTVLHPDPSSDHHNSLEPWLREKIRAAFGSVAPDQLAIHWYRNRTSKLGRVEVEIPGHVLYIDLLGGERHEPIGHPDHCEPAS